MTDMLQRSDKALYRANATSRDPEIRKTNHMIDLQGRAYATVDATKAGDKLQADADFDCIKAGAVLTVTGDADGLYVPCSDGKHCLAGQIMTDGQPHYIGLYPVA